MPDPALPPGAADQPPAAVIASRLQARFERLEAPAATRAAPAGLEPGSVARPGARSGDAAAQRQLDELNGQLLALCEQLDVAFDELELRIEEADARAAVAESRASVAESRAAAAEARVEAAIAAVAELEARIGSGGPEEGVTNLRSALDRLRNRLDVG